MSPRDSAQTPSMKHTHRIQQRGALLGTPLVVLEAHAFRLEGQKSHRIALWKHQRPMRQLGFDPRLTGEQQVHATCGTPPAIPNKTPRREGETAGPQPLAPHSALLWRLTWRTPNGASSGTRGAGQTKPSPKTCYKLSSCRRRHVRNPNAECVKPEKPVCKNQVGTTCGWRLSCRKPSVVYMFMHAVDTPHVCGHAPADPHELGKGMQTQYTIPITRNTGLAGEPLANPHVGPPK